MGSHRRERRRLSESRAVYGFYSTANAVDGDLTTEWSTAGDGDGDLTTEWSTAGDGDDASITIALGSATEVGAVEFLTRSMTDGSAIAETYTLTVDDQETFGPFPAGNPADSQPADISVTGQTFRFEVATSTGGNTGAVEIGLFAP